MEENKPYIKAIENPCESDINRFWNNVDFPKNRDLCWNWNGFVQNEKKPYGVFSLRGKKYNVKKTYTASRFAYFLHYNIDPLELCVLHKCDNPQCVNPNHLFLGTNDDNIKDKVQKGRQAKNECWNKGKETKFRLWDNKNCKATKEDFLEMKSIYEQNKMSVNELAEKFKISKRAVSKGIRALGGIVPEVHSILQKETVLEIRYKYENTNISYAKLAKAYGININTVNQILRRKTWKHI